MNDASVARRALPGSSRGPRVLFLSGLQVYPTTSGGTLRSFGLAGALHRQGVHVRVHSLTGRRADYLARRPSSVQIWPDGVEEYVDRSLLPAAAHFGSARLGVAPVWLTAHLAAAAASPREVLLPGGLRQKLGWCDTIVADYPFLHSIFSAPSARGKLRIVNTHNIEHDLCGGGNGLNRWTRGSVRRIEVRAAEACDLLVCCCADDARFFADNARVRRSVLVPNGIDLRRFRGLGAHRDATRRALALGDDVKVFLFTASRFGPNREAFDYLVAFARNNARWLVEQGIHILVVGNVTRQPLRSPGFTATGRVDAVEPHFAAADAALNPMASGAGTNLKMCEFIAARLPILSTPFGARGFRIEDGKTGFLFEKDGLAAALSTVRRMLDEDPRRLHRMTDDAYAQNESVIDMDSSVQGLVEAMVGSLDGRTALGAPEHARRVSA